MPKPSKGEQKSDFISRCIPIVLDEGTAGSQDQAVAICNSLWDEHRTSEMVMRDYIIGEFRGKFPQIDIDSRVDIDALTRGDDDPFFVSLPVARIGEVSSNGLFYDEELVKTIEEQLIGKGGIMGHIKHEDRTTAFPIEDVDWVGYKRVNGTTWAKGYVPPGEAREYIRRLMARGGRLATSIYGPYDEPETQEDGSSKLRGFKLESLDLAPADRAALRLGGEFAITAQMTKKNEGDEIMDKKQLLAELVAGDIPPSLRQTIIQEWQQEQGEQDKVKDLEKQLGDSKVLIETLQGQIDQSKVREFDATLDAKVAELVDWKVESDDAKKKVDAFKRTLRTRILSEMGDDRDADKLNKTADEVWAEMKPLAETIRDALAGPAAAVGGRTGTDYRKLKDTPEARAKARASMGL